MSFLEVEVQDVVDEYNKEIERLTTRINTLEDFIRGAKDCSWFDFSWADEAESLLE